MLVLIPFPCGMIQSSSARSSGCQQTVVSEYTHTSLSAGQQSALVEAFGLLKKRWHNGVSVGSVLLVNSQRIAGMARSAFYIVHFTSFLSGAILNILL